MGAEDISIGVPITGLMSGSGAFRPAASPAASAVAATPLATTFSHVSRIGRIFRLANRWHTRLGYGAVAGALCLLLRHMGSYEESVCFAVMLANAAMPLLYRLQGEIYARRELKRKTEEGAAKPGRKTAKRLVSGDSPREGTLCP